MDTPLRLLLVEDNENDAMLIIRHLEKMSYSVAFLRVETAAEMKTALEQQDWDVIICDYSLPYFNAPEALKILQKTDIDLPFIVVSGTVGEDTAVEMMRTGAHDYMMKSNLIRLAPVIKREIDEAIVRCKRKLADEELLQSEKKYKYLFENNPLPMWIYDLETLAFLNVNEAAVTHYGYSREEFAGMTIKDICPSNDVDSLLKDVQNATELHNRAGAWQHIKKNGEIIFVEIISHRIEYDSKQARLVLANDITERKRTEQLQAILYAISNAVIATEDVETLIAFIRQQLSTIIDTTNFYIALYDDTTDFISIPYFADQKDKITSFPSGKTLTSYVIRTKKSFLGTRRDLDKMEADGLIESIGGKAKVWLGVPLLLKEKVIGVFAVQSYEDENAYNKADMEMLEFVSDQISISIQRQKTVENLKKVLAKAEESDRLKTAFLTNMSHEIRTPMNAILGFTRLLEDDTILAEERRKFIDIITDNTQHLLTILTNIVEISKIESNMVILNNSLFNVNQMLDDLMKTWKNKIAVKGEKQLIFHLYKTLPDNQCNINTDKERLSEILNHLLSNAIKFTKEGSVELGYACHEGHLQFFVQDTGKGIPASKQMMIFEKFRQENETFTREYGGNGLGLSISKGLVELLGGTIGLVSEEGKGSKFFFTLPVSLQVLPTLVTDEKPFLQKKEYQFSGRTILVADDVSENLELLQLFLKTTGITVLFANNGKEAVEICKINPSVDLVLMDLQMPVMNGFDATLAIRSFNPRLPIIAFTAFENEKQRSLDSGCTDFITKPVIRKTILAMIDKYL